MADNRARRGYAVGLYQSGRMQKCEAGPISLLFAKAVAHNQARRRYAVGVYQQAARGNVNLAPFRVQTSGPRHLQKMLAFIGTHWETITAIASGFVALCALGLTFYQAHLTRKHNKISVTPRLTSWRGLDTLKNEPRLSVTIKNSGIGPAEIRDFAIYVDEQRLSGRHTEPIERALRLLFPAAIYHAHHAFVAPGHFIAAGDSFVLLDVTFHSPRAPTEAELLHAEARTRLVIQYASMYGELSTFDSKRFQKE